MWFCMDYSCMCICVHIVIFAYVCTVVIYVYMSVCSPVCNLWVFSSVWFVGTIFYWFLLWTTLILFWTKMINVEILHLKVHRNSHTKITLRPALHEMETGVQRSCLASRIWCVPKTQPFSAATAPTFHISLLTSSYLSTATQTHPWNPFLFHLQITYLLLTQVHVSFLPVFFLPALRLWCWQIQSLRAAFSSALMREPVSRSTASLFTSWACYSTQLRRIGP